jgi:photosystem II S4 domain protein
MLPREDLLKRAEYRETIARLVDGADQALRTWELVVTDFLSPPELAESHTLFQSFTEITLIAAGGYPQAERQRLGICRADLSFETQAIPLSLLSIEGNFLFDPANHRDFLGALLGTGLVRDKVGDILVLGNRGAQAIVVPELAEFLELNLTQVRSVPVKTRRTDWEALQVRPPQTKSLTTVEASLRLDAVASAGFGMSRSKMVDLITRGEVRVNWKTITQSSFLLKTTDLVAIRGKGRLTVGDITVTKKDRYRIELTRSL